MDEIRCPICGKPLHPPKVAAHPHFPFCSKRCQLLDLSRWMDGSYSIEGTPAAEAEDEQADPPPED